MEKYSIILPVKNGGEYVKECVKSILGQTFENFNLVVLDNCSTDGTGQWISSLGDPRISVHFADRPLTIEENWARITGVKKNEFITLIGHDDVLNPGYLQTMEHLIAMHPQASLYQTHFNYIDKAGKVLRPCKPMAEVEDANGFLGSFLLNNIDIMGTGFMMRSLDYDRLGGMPFYPNLLFADFELWVRLTQLSYKATSAKNCFSFRLHQSTTAVSPDIKMQKAFDQFVRFLHRLQLESPGLAEVIRKDGRSFVKTYCKGLSHRLLRTPFSKREGLTVKSFLKSCKQYVDMLEPLNDYDPLQDFSVRLALWLDSSALGRNLFLQFKKIYSKPVLK